MTEPEDMCEQGAFSNDAVSIATQSLSGLAWVPDHPAQFWLVHPPASGLSTSAPYHHPAGPRCPYTVLEAAFAEAAKLRHPGPVFFVVPELSIDPARTAELRARISALPPNHTVIIGMGHLTALECDAFETGLSTTPGLWARSWADARYANAALIATHSATFLEAKHWPSKFEQDADCHMPCRRIRIFSASGFRFAVVICSEMLGTPLPSGFAAALAAQNLDVLFWLQHNPNPRHDLFVPQLEAFYRTLGHHTLIVSVNKRPDVPDRAPFGVSSFIAPVGAFATRKAFLLRPNWACEPIASGAARAVFVRYDADVHAVSTLRPRDVPTIDPPGRFLEQTDPYVITPAGLVPAPVAAHIDSLLALGRPVAAAEAALGSAYSPLATELAAVENDIKASANLLSNLLDSALLQVRGVGHDNHASHSPASCCACWPHRENFDTMFDGDLPAAVAELALAVAALRHSGIAVEVDPTSRMGNVALTAGGRSTEFLLGWSVLRVPDFLALYRPSPRPGTSVTPVILLRSPPAPSSLPASAATIPPIGHVHAAQVASPSVPLLSGASFWNLIRLGGLADRIVEMAA